MLGPAQDDGAHGGGGQQERRNCSRRHERRNHVGLRQDEGMVRCGMYAVVRS